MDSLPPPRHVRIVLVDPNGRLIGALPPTPVALPWWQEVAPVVRAVRVAHGARITVLRLLEVGGIGPMGREITYLAETRDSIAADPWDGALEDHPLRLAYARPSGPAADLAWAQGVMADQGFTPAGAPEQMRSWNLSSLWRLPVVGQTLWLKVVPPFFAHEGAVLELLGGQITPTLLARDGGRILMAEVPGRDLYGAAGAALPPMIDLIVALQSRYAGGADELIALGVPDLRAPVLIPAIRAVIDRNRAALSPDEQAVLAAFAEGLPDRFARVADCGLPDTLVHGDAHPGNLRGDGDRLILLDWADSCVGHPMLDEPGFLGRIAPDDVEVCSRYWHDAWRAVVPGSDPDLASTLLSPVAAARQAVVYQGFLDRIEPSEHPYHRDDPKERLAHAAALIRAEASA
jgi:hypothetical protein